MTENPSLPPIRPPDPVDAGAIGKIRPRESDPDGPGFAEILKNSIQHVNALQKDADQAIEDLTTGKTENFTEVLTAVEKADLAFRAVMQIRNKLLDAYEEINRLRV